MKLGQSLLIVGVVVIGVGALLFWAYSAASAPLPVGFPPPTADGEIEIKQYPDYRAATVQVTGNLANAPSQGFSPLFRHISSNDIAMTAPVETRYPTATLDASTVVEGDASVSFLYRSLDIVPQEIAQNVQVEDIPPMTVVSVGVRGGYGYEVYTSGLQQLKTWLAAHPEYAVAGPPRRFFYDGPYVPDALKRSDIQIPVRQN
ncbi:MULTISPECIES: heme-binding protein [Cyanophyceae]|uniref:Heme-binding protein n=1 Tax=Leptolyngbya subtilissima DQ-A4 TaxID=2933933 RepID=A0ABV0JYD5_9CYAN|nr:heme-binding protein [Nodosilinea sp. FACHB-141]MBD2112089.1 heme-binding protein [Nodosilinea sp. FACHB-141]